jgi:lysophospholipase L1-like esterase
MIKDDAKTILCFGDSNTWGSIPLNTPHRRYPRSIRWPYALQALLGDNFEVISEGLSARTLVAHNPERPERTGISHLPALLRTAEPLSLVIVMLGTNDVKSNYNLSAEDIASHLGQTIKLIQDYQKDLAVLVICPPTPIFNTEGGTDPRMPSGPEIFVALPDLYKKIVIQYKAHFLNAADYIQSSVKDGVHLEPDAHLKLAEVLRQVILDLQLK